MLKDIIKKNIEKHSLIDSGDLVILGLSGGPDSMCLMDVLYDLKDRMKFELVFAHVSHNFRIAEGRKDMEFVRSIGEKYNVKTFVKEVDCPKMALDMKISGEEAGRLARYEFFNEIENLYTEKGCENSYRREQIKVAVAHNMWDQSETILFRILRGSGVDGIAGIEYKSKNAVGSNVIRPMLNISRNRIEEYCEEKRLNPRMDETNQKDVYTRNKIRLKLIPCINEMFNTDVNKTLFSLGENAKIDKEYMWAEADKAYGRVLLEENLKYAEKSVVFIQRELWNYHSAIVHRVLLKAFRKIGLNKDVLRGHIAQALEIIKIENRPKELTLPDGFTLEVAYGRVTCIKRVKNEKKFLKKREFSSLEKCEDYIKNNLSEKHKVQYAVFDFEKLKQKYAISEDFREIELRNRKSGDYIRLNGIAGRKKLQDFLVDMKVPRQERDRIDLVCIADEILWIADDRCRRRKNCEFTLDNSTKHIILLEIQGILC